MEALVVIRDRVRVGVGRLLSDTRVVGPPKIWPMAVPLFGLSEFVRLSLNRPIGRVFSARDTLSFLTIPTSDSESEYAWGPDCRNVRIQEGFHASGDLAEGDL
jgi:hypothetical protein